MRFGFVTRRVRAADKGRGGSKKPKLKFDKVKRGKNVSVTARAARD